MLSGAWVAWRPCPPDGGRRRPVWESLRAAVLPRDSTHPADSQLESRALGVSPPWPVIGNAPGARLTLGFHVLVGIGGTHLGHGLPRSRQLT